jgi:uncharacterized protein YbbC (DUF1343 family)/CubicO group peptidase (beta-lactamase class C family)
MISRSGLLTVLPMLFALPAADPGRLPEVSPAAVGMDVARLALLEPRIREAIEKKQLPGAVVLVVRQGNVAYRQAFGQRTIEPAPEAMTADTIFDLASLTKSVATATSIMLLVEQGKLRLDDAVAKHRPHFAQHGKEKLTIEQLLLHTSGLIADNPVHDYDDGREQALERIDALKPVAEPGSKFIYSDVNFIVLGELVQQLSGMPLDLFAAKHLFEPLGMRDTGFKPAAGLTARIAPTEKRGETWLRGLVHDPRATKLGGVAGHAGLFGTADDLAVFVQMLLSGGELNGRRILKRETIALMTQARPVPGGQRAYGWDVQTSYSANRGERFPLGKSFGHTGFTGTSLWIDPTSQTAVIFLSNRLHPDGKGNVTRLRGQVATLVAEAIVAPPLPAAPAESKVLTGIDVLTRDGFRELKGKRVGLVTNHTGVDRTGVPTIDLLHRADGVTLVALFSPEHGIRGEVDKAVADAKDEKTGLLIYSLYGQRRKPTAEQLKDVDTLVFDIQDIGCRFYTYSSTLGLILEAAAENKRKVIVLDRPNPIGGVAVAGPVLDAGRESFTAYHRLPIRHGLTVGELARLYNAERNIGADLEVIRVEGWRRAELFDRTGLPWINPSPNMRSLTAALLYPGIGLLETTNLSVGRGTDRPFEVLGAPWLDGQRLADELRAAKLPGVRFVPTRLTPASSTHAGKLCGGVQIYLDDWERFEPLRTGITIACALRKLHGPDWQRQRYGVLLGHQQTLEALERGDGPDRIMELWRADLESFRKRRQAVLLYD